MQRQLMHREASMSPNKEPDLMVVGLNSSEKDGFSAAERPANCRDSEMPVLC